MLQSLFAVRRARLRTTAWSVFRADRSGVYCGGAARAAPIGHDLITASPIRSRRVFIRQPQLLSRIRRVLWGPGSGGVVGGGGGQPQLLRMGVALPFGVRGGWVVGVAGLGPVAAHGRLLLVGGGRAAVVGCVPVPVLRMGGPFRGCGWSGGGGGWVQLQLLRIGWPLRGFGWSGGG